MIATDYTYEQYIASGWDEAGLIKHGKAQLVNVAPQPQPQAAAPQPMPVEGAPQPAAEGAPFQPHDPNVPDTNTDYAGQI